MERLIVLWDRDNKKMPINQTRKTPSVESFFMKRFVMSEFNQWFSRISMDSLLSQNKNSEVIFFTFHRVQDHSHTYAQWGDVIKAVSGYV